MADRFHRMALDKAGQDDLAPEIPAMDDAFRSVVRDAVRMVEGNAGTMQLQLSDGLFAPGAWQAVIHAKAAGWLVSMGRRREPNRP